MSKKSSPTLAKRFSGRGGRDRLIDALRNQFLIGGDQEIAREVARHTYIQHLSANDELITEGAPDNEIYFILSGSISIHINGRQVATRAAGEHVGEMALLDTTALRSATARSIEATVVAALKEARFTPIANRHPSLWRRMALALAKRLRERNKFHIAPRTEPVIFIGSSGEGLNVAKKIQRNLNRLPVVANLWSQGVFECSKTAIEDLMRVTKQTDFAILVLTPDDVTKSRGKTSASPRDNVIFEIGLFTGSLSRERTYVVASKSTNLKIPTDLLGVTCLLFQRRRGQSLTRSLQGVFRSLKSLISKYGPI